MLKQDALENANKTNGWLKLTGCLLLAALFAFGPAAAGGDVAGAKTYRFSQAGQVVGLQATMGKSRTIKLDSAFAEVHVGNPEVADILPLTNSSFYVMGKKIGTTSLSIYTVDKKLLGVFDLEVTYDIHNLRRRIRQNIRGARVKVSSLNGKIHLTGSVPNAPAAHRAVAFAEQFAPKKDVMNSLSVTSSQQVMLEVRFVEASRTAGKELGFNFFANSKNVNAASGLPLLSNSVPFASVLTNLLSGGFNADLLIDALEERGLARRLAEPNLTALSGDTASFLAGGEFPFPVGADNGEIKIEFKKFGVGLAFTPTVLSGGLINVKIEPEVSQLDPTTTLRLNGFEIPSLIVRRAQTTVELRDGQSFAIAGLLQSNHTKSKAQLPWIAEVPILGALFRSSSYQKDETDLVIIVTPHLVRPAAPGQHLATPLDARSPSNDVDFFMNGKMDVSKKAVKYYENGGRFGPGGHILSANSQAPAKRTAARTRTNIVLAAKITKRAPQARPQPVLATAAAIKPGKRPVPAAPKQANVSPEKTKSKTSARPVGLPDRTRAAKPAENNKNTALTALPKPVPGQPELSPAAPNTTTGRTNFAMKTNVRVDAYVSE